MRPLAINENDGWPHNYRVFC